MKHSIVFLTAIIAMLTSTLLAQDTVHTRIPPANYFTPIWPVSYVNDGKPLICLFDYQTEDWHTKAQTFYKYTNDSLTIYGIAASMISEKDLYPNYFHPGDYQDSSYDEVYDYLCIYEAGPTQPILLGERLKVHMHHTPISYYIDFDAGRPYDPGFIWPAHPMYERYFRNPIKVVDSFYVGRECHACRRDTNTLYTTMPILLVEALPAVGDTMPLYQKRCSHLYYNNFGETEYDSTHFMWYYDTTHSERNLSIPLLFPILTPPPSVRDTSHAIDTSYVGDTVIVLDTTIIVDTLIIDNDTIITYDTIVTYDTILAINDAGLLGRLTGVMPNPAAESARVVSSFGMSRVEVYNLAGERVHDMRVPEGSLYTNLDVRRWPQGVYIVRIHTPLGVTSKKLTVQR